MKKYTLTNETKTIQGKTLYRIQAVRSFDDVKNGDLGGYMEKKKTYHTAAVLGCVIMLVYLAMLG